MSICEARTSEEVRDLGWRSCSEQVVVAMSAMNLATVALVEAIGELLDSEGWTGVGIRSPEHWVSWKANVSRRRAEGLVEVARRRGELPRCWALFAEGRLTEDAMVRIARRVPVGNDRRVAGLAPQLTISQLNRLLASLPPLEPEPEPKQRARYVGFHTHDDGSGEGTISLPAGEWAVFLAGLMAARDAEHRDRQGLPVDAEVDDPDARHVSWADGLVRMASEACDAFDATFVRTGHRGERNQIVLHHEVRDDGTLGPGRLHLGPVIDDSVARYLACDAQVILVAYKDGKMIGINPIERTPNRRLRRYLEHRDGGCAHPVCDAKRWLHAHHLRHWEDGGPTEASNLVCLCAYHHRALHRGEYTIDGNPEDGTLVFRDLWGQAIGPPTLGASQLPPQGTPPNAAYQPPCGEPLHAHHLTWN